MTLSLLFLCFWSCVYQLDQLVLMVAQWSAAYASTDMWSCLQRSWASLAALACCLARQYSFDVSTD